MAQDARSAALAKVRGAAGELLAGGNAYDFCRTYMGLVGDLATGGPLTGLDLELFRAVEQWEPPGPTRREAEVALRSLAAKAVPQLS